MNILFLDSIDKETYGGYQNWIRLVAMELIKRGHKITIAGRPDSEYLRRVGEADEHIVQYPLKLSGDFHPVTISKLKPMFYAGKNIQITP